MKQELLSVGIDIGTSTTQLVFSKITVENTASSFSVPRIAITDKKIAYKSKIYFTPLLDHKTIDCDGIKTIIENEYHHAGVPKEKIDTGAVIITGETARKENAREVLQTLSGFAGDFVVATAGPDLESIISGKGAGASEYSKKHKTNVLNIDIGGGTSNFALFHNGEVIDTGCMDIGGRLIKIDKDRHITYISPKIQKIAPDLKVGMELTEHNISPVIEKMVQTLMQGANILPRDELFDLFVTNKGIAPHHKIDCISFSGGVSDYVYNQEYDELYKYGDIGVILGKAIYNSRLETEYKLVKASETIRATVVGAGTHTTEISGSTISYTDNVLPLKNLPVLKLTEDDESNLAEAIHHKIEWYKADSKIDKLAIAFKGVKPPSFTEITKYAEDIVKSTKMLNPLVIVTENDIAKALGQTLQSKTSSPIVCIDGIQLSNGDYIDIGKPVADGAVVPVVIKTLVFN